MAQRRAHVTIKGHVQGVYFRSSTRDRAKRFGVDGWVKNLANGDVEGVFEGEEEDVKRLISWCRQGPPRARVDEVEVNWEKPQEDFNSFRIRY